MSNLNHSYRIKLKSVQHYLKCVASLKEYGVYCNVGAESIYELDLRRLTKSEWKRKGYIYIGCNRQLHVFLNKSVVRYAVPIKRKELLKCLRKS